MICGNLPTLGVFSVEQLAEKKFQNRKNQDDLHTDLCILSDFWYGLCRKHSEISLNFPVERAGKAVFSYTN